MNYFNTFIAVAEDTAAKTGTEPPQRGDKKTVAALEYELISSRPYELTQEDVQFTVHVQRSDIPADRLRARKKELWQEFFAKPMACMRASPLPKTYGWGLHFDPQGKVALVSVDSDEYRQLSTDSSIEQTRAMRSKRSK